MLAVTMALCKMRDGITLSRAVQVLESEYPDYRLTDAALQCAASALYVSMQDHGISPDTRLDYLDAATLRNVAQRALDIHLEVR